MRNAEQVLRTPKKRCTVFGANYDAAVDRGAEISAQCDFSLGELSYEYPEEILSQKRSAIDELDYQTYKAQMSVIQMVCLKLSKAICAKSCNIAQIILCPVFSNGL